MVLLQWEWLLKENLEMVVVVIKMVRCYASLEDVVSKIKQVETVSGNTTEMVIKGYNGWWFG